MPAASLWEIPLSDPLLKKIDATLFHEGETVLVAVSGGADSVALLDILHHLPKPRLKLVVAHLNHALRGDASAEDARFVTELAQGYALSCITSCVDVKALALKERLCLEDAGRSARYRFFAEAAASCGATSIALAHHRDDQAETVLIRLLRGAGGAGLAAMKPVSQGVLKRPLLRVSRQELEGYLKQRGIIWRTDATNADTTILRNSIRHELIPYLKRYNVSVSERLAATAEILAADEELLEELTAASFARHAGLAADRVTLDCQGVRGESRGLRMRLFRQGIRVVQGDLGRIALPHLEAIDRLLFTSRPNARFSLPGGVCVTRSYGALTFTRTPEPANASWQLQVAAEGEHRLPDGRGLSVRLVARPADLVPPSRRIAYLCPLAAPFPWLLRGFQAGDRLRPLGMKGEQKVKDLFMNLKIPLVERRSIPLLFSAGRLLWVCGVRMGEPARVGEQTEVVLRVELLD